MLTLVVLVEMTRGAMHLSPTLLVLWARASLSIGFAELASTQRAINPRGSALASVLERTIFPRAQVPLFFQL